MKHTFSADEVALGSLESAQAYLSENCTRNQTLIISRAVEHCWATLDQESRYPNPLHVAAQLKHMRADTPIIVSAIFGSDVASKNYSAEFIREHYGQEIAELTRGVRWLNELEISDAFGSGDHAETLRRMVLSMVEDIRVVLVKLAFRTQRLYEFVKHDSEKGVAVAQETLLVYAPLANRLGLAN